MSNDVDILFVDGDAAGKMVCQPRPVPATLSFPTVNTPTVYTHVDFAHTNGKHYHIARSDVDTTNEQIEALIAAASFTPGWDINPKPE